MWYIITEIYTAILMQLGGYMPFFEIFSNRELSVGFWLILLFIYAISIKKVRSSFFNVIKILFSRKIIIPLLAMTYYIFLQVRLLQKISFWEISLLKETIIWGVGFGFATFMNSTDAGKTDNYFRNIISGSITFLVAIEFIFGLHSFSFLFELFFVPIIVFLGVLQGYSSAFQKYAPVQKILGVIIGFTSLTLLAITIKEIFLEFEKFATIDTLKEFLLTPILSVTLLPFLYFFALALHYETLFVRIDIRNSKKKIRNKIKLLVVLFSHINLNKLVLFASTNRMLRATNFEEIQRLFENVSEADKEITAIEIYKNVSEFRMKLLDFLKNITIKKWDTKLLDQIFGIFIGFSLWQMYTIIMEHFHFFQSLAFLNLILSVEFIIILVMAYNLKNIFFKIATYFIAYLIFFSGIFFLPLVFDFDPILKSLFAVLFGATMWILIKEPLSILKKAVKKS